MKTTVVQITRTVEVEPISLEKKTLRVIAQELESRLVDLTNDNISVGFDWKTQAESFPETGWRWIACYAITGESEGCYVHVQLTRPEGGGKLLFWIKVFDELEYAQKLASFCGLLLNA